MTPQCGFQTHAGEFFCIELFAGSAGVTFAMKHFFKQSFGVDHKSGAAKARVVCLDLTITTNQDCLWVHSGVPCGTASKARQIRMSKKKHGPPPLRIACGGHWGSRVSRELHLQKFVLPIFFVNSHVNYALSWTKRAKYSPLRTHGQVFCGKHHTGKRSKRLRSLSWSSSTTVCFVAAGRNILAWLGIAAT